MKLISKQSFRILTPTMLLLFFVLPVIVMVCAGSVSAAGLGIGGNKITLKTTGTPSGTYTPSIGTDGVVIDGNTDAMQGDGLYTIDIPIVNDGFTSDATYTVELGIVVDDADNSRRVEAYLPGVQVTTTSTTTKVTLQANNDLRISGRSSDGITTFSTSLSNGTAESSVTAADNTLTFNFSNLQQKIEDKFGAATGNANILNSILETGKYAYTILIKSTSVPIGYVSGGTTVSAFPSANIASGCGNYGENLAAITGSPIANSSYLTGTSYYIRGSYGVGAGNTAPAVGDAPTSNGACSTTPDPDPDPAPAPTPTPTPTTTAPTATDVGALDTTDPTAVQDVVDNFVGADLTEAGNTLSTLGNSTVAKDLENAAVVVGKMGESTAGAESGGKILGKMGESDAGAEAGGKILGKMGESASGAESGGKILAKMGESDAGAESGAKILDKMSKSTNTQDLESAAEIIKKVETNSGGTILSKMEPTNAVSILNKAVEQSTKLTQAQKDAEYEKIKNLTGTTFALKIIDYFQTFQATVSSLMFAATGSATIIEQYLQDPKMIEVIEKTANGALNLKSYLSPLASGLLDGSMVTGYVEELLGTTTFTVKALTKSGALDVNTGGLSYPAAMVNIILKDAAPTGGDSIQEYKNGFGFTFAKSAGLGALEVILVPIFHDVDGLKTLIGASSTSLDADNGYLIFTDADKNEYVASFGWGSGSSSSKTDGKEIVSLSLKGTDVASADYAIEIVYKDGSVQKMVPAVKNIDTLFAALSDWTTQGAIDQFSFDKDSGVLSVTLTTGEEFKYKPSYQVQAMTNSDLTSLVGVKSGIVWMDNDYNNDGLLDLKFITTDGSQILYSVSK